MTITRRKKKRVPKHPLQKMTAGSTAQFTVQPVTQTISAVADERDVANCRSPIPSKFWQIRGNGRRCCRSGNVEGQCLSPFWQKFAVLAFGRSIGSAGLAILADQIFLQLTLSQNCAASCNLPTFPAGPIGENYH